MMKCGVERRLSRVTYPSVYSACRRPKYDSHLLPMTLPQVKQRIGIIIL